MIPQIQIPKPCSQNPRNFYPTGKGGFCQSCQKEVVDFRKMSHKEVLNFIGKNPHSTCGVFLKKQVETVTVKNENKKLGPLWILSFMGLLGITTPSYSQTLNTPIQEQTTQTASSNTSKHTSQAGRIVRGKIFSAEDKGELPGVTILIKGTKIGTATNLDGEFVLEIPDSIKKNKIRLIISFVGFTIQEEKVSLKENSVNIGSVYLQEDQSVLGPYGIITPKKSLLNQLASYFRKETINSKA